jgi:hypothetical protein
MESFSGDFSVGVFLNGNEITSFVESFIINEDCVSVTPDIQLVLKLQTSIDDVLLDGSLISIIVQSLKFKETYSFMLTDYGMDQRENQYVYTVNGIIACQKLFDIRVKSYPNSAVSSVLKNICDELKFESDLIQTLDTQTWLQNNIPTIDFIKDAARHSYRNNSSCMKCCLSRTGKLYLKDLAEIENSKFNDDNIIDNNSGMFTISDGEDSSGIFARKFGGYGVKFDIFSIKTSQVTNTIPPKIKSNYPNTLLNKNNRANQFYRYCIDACNTHANYDQAYCQNQMIAAQYANRKTIESYMTNFNIFDKVRLNIYNINQGELVEAESGYYIRPVSKIIY